VRPFIDGVNILPIQMEPAPNLSCSCPQLRNHDCRQLRQHAFYDKGDLLSLLEMGHARCAGSRRLIPLLRMAWTRSQNTVCRQCGGNRGHRDSVSDGGADMVAPPCQYEPQGRGSHLPLNDAAAACNLGRPQILARGFLL